MGPLLFNIFINDIVETSSLFDLIMYSHETTLISTRTFANVNINTEISKITTWFKSNMLEIKFKIMDLYLVQLYTLHYKI